VERGRVAKVGIEPRAAREVAWAQDARQTIPQGAATTRTTRATAWTSAH